MTYPSDIRLAEAAVRADPLRPAAWLALGDLFDKVGEKKEASYCRKMAEDFRRAAAAVDRGRSKDPAAWEALGKLLAEVGAHDKASYCYKMAEEFKSDLGVAQAAPVQLEHLDTPAMNKLVSQVETGECILFLGAGVHSAPPEGSGYAYPAEQRPLLGRALAEKLAEECGFKKKFPDEEPSDLQRVSLCFETSPGLGRHALVDSLDRHLRHEKKPSPTLRMLAGLPFKIIVTTNYDLLLDSALRERGREPAIFVYDPQDNPTPDMRGDPTAKRPLLFKMHGDLDHRSCIVITDEDYITFVQRMSVKAEAFHPVPETIRYRMKKWPMLFIGYSLRDFNLRLLFRTLRLHVDTANFPTSFSVDSNPDQLIVKVWQDERRYVTFLTEDIWEFVPWLFKAISRKEYPA